MGCSGMPRSARMRFPGKGREGGSGKYQGGDNGLALGRGPEGYKIASGHTRQPARCSCGLIGGQACQYFRQGNREGFPQSRLARDWIGGKSSGNGEKWRKGQSLYTTTQRTVRGHSAFIDTRRRNDR